MLSWPVGSVANSRTPTGRRAGRARRSCGCHGGCRRRRSRRSPGRWMLPLSGRLGSWWRRLVALAGRLDRTGMSHRAGSYEVTFTRPVRAGESPGSVDSSYPRQPKRQWVNRARLITETHPTHSPITPVGWWMRADVIIPVGVVGAGKVPGRGLSLRSLPQARSAEPV